VPLNPGYRDAELAYFLTDARPSVVVCPDRNVAWMEPMARAASVAHLVTLNEDSTGSLMDAVAGLTGDFATVDLPDDALASLLYTSGTTGRSKGAMISHGNLAAHATTLHRYWGWSSHDVLLHMLPIFHIHGLFVAVNGALLAGAKMLWLPRFDAREAIRLLPRATLLMGVPTFYTRLLAEPALTRDACRQIRLFVSGSAPLLRETFTAFQERTGHTILERYGMSETGMLASNPYFPSDGVRCGGTVGRPLPGVSLRVMNDQGERCQTGEIGTVEVKGAGVCSGYWQMPEKTRDAFTSDGYFRTGDLGHFGGAVGGMPVPDDYLTLAGRGSDMFISGGFNVYPREIEGYIDELDGVEESAVVGVPHPDFGEVGIALVVARPGETLSGEEIQAHLKGRIASFKVPKRVVITTALPRNAMGKVQKNILRETYRDTLKG
jgi:malonyl-CoA/methylmalonyl-CoA synthetase